ncbi:MAG TPA: oligoendopeptidase F [Chloroflexota bacterium]|jgi:oligoendopeptidase F
MPRPTREQVPPELTWDLGHIYPTAAAWEADLTALEGDLERVTAYRGRLGEGAGTLRASLEARDGFIERLSRVNAYARLHLSTDGLSSANQAMSARSESFGARAGAALAFLTTELVALPDGTIERYLGEDPGLETYRLQLEDVVRSKPHVLEPQTEEVLAALDEALHLPMTVWQRVTTADLRCEPTQDGEGREIPVSIAAYQFGLRYHPEREVRRRAYESLSAGLDRHKATLATTLAAHIKKNVTTARLRGYSSAAEMILAPQRIPLEVYRNVCDTVHDGMAPHVRRLLGLRSRRLGLDELRMYDLEAPLDPGYDPPTSYAESERLIREGLSPLGAEYETIVSSAFQNRWIDRADNLGKRSGAFCATVYGVHSYVFTTWSDSLRNALILAHELGHAGHGMLASRNQVISNARSGLFFVEAPSTANELLVGQHILDTAAGDGRLRRFVIMQFLGTFLHNMVTHMLEAHFERRLYELAEADQPLTVGTVLQVQGEVFDRFYGDSVKVDDPSKLYWTQQPHFYINLYPYTYAAGLACGTVVADDIRREGEPAARRWLDTLRRGGSLPPLELAGKAGVDMASPEPIERAIAFFGRLVDELERSFV